MTVKDALHPYGLPVTLVAHVCGLTRQGLHVRFRSNPAGFAEGVRKADRERNASQARTMLDMLTRLSGEEWTGGIVGGCLHAERASRAGFVPFELGPHVLVERSVRYRLALLSEENADANRLPDTQTE